MTGAKFDVVGVVAVDQLSADRHRFERRVVAERLVFPVARRLGRRLSYFAAVELQRRGNVHMHILMRDTGYIPKAVVHALGYESGFGFSDIRQVNPASGVKYVTKYLTKSAGQVMPKGVRRVRMSQDWYEKPKQPLCVWGEGWQWQAWDAVDPDFVEHRLLGDGVLNVHRLDVEVSSDD